MVPLLGTEFVPQGRLLRDAGQLLHAGRLVARADRDASAQQVEAALRELPEVRYTFTTINTGDAQGKIYATLYVRLVDRKPSARAASTEMTRPLRERLARIAGITVTHVGLLDLGRRQQS